MKYDELFGQIDQEVPKSDKYKAVQYPSRMRESGRTAPMEFTPEGNRVTPVPGLGTSFREGMRQAAEDTRMSKEFLETGKPRESIIPPSGAAAPLEWGLPSSSGASKLAYRIGGAVPEIGAGLVGGRLGGNPGAALGAGLMNAYKTIGPAFSRRLRETPDNPDLAYQKALGDTVLSAGGTAVSWGAYPLKFFEGPVYNLVMQAFGIQPGIGATQKAIGNIREGKPILEGQSETYLESAAGTAVPAIGHAGINIASGKAPFAGWGARPPETAPPVPRSPQPPVGPTDAGLLRARRFQEPFGTADLQRFLQQENLNAPRSTPSSPISGQLYSPGLNDRGYIPERPTGAVSPRFRPEPTSVRQRLREFEGGPIEAGPPIATPEGQPGPRPEAEGAMAAPNQGRPAYMATREEVARQSFSPEEVQALREEGLSPEQARVSGREPQSRLNVNQEQPTSLEAERGAIGKAFDINQPIWQKRILELMRQGYKGKELSDKLRELYGADTAGMGVLPGQRAGLPGSHQFPHHRTFPSTPGLPSPASGMLRTGERTSAARPPITSRPTLEAAYRKKVMEIRDDPYLSDQEKRGLIQQATVKFQRSLERLGNTPKERGIDTWKPPEQLEGERLQAEYERSPQYKEALDAYRSFMEAGFAEMDRTGYSAEAHQNLMDRAKPLRDRVAAIEAELKRAVARQSSGQTKQHHRTFPPAPGLPSPASGMLRTGQRTSRQRGDRGYVAPRGQEAALSEAGEQQARTLYERRVAEIESSDMPPQDRKEALRVAAREYQTRIEERVQERRGVGAGRPKKYNWESIAENWAGKKWDALSKKEQEALKNAYRYYERSSGKLKRVQEEAARQEGQQPPKYTPTKRSEAFTPEVREQAKTKLYNIREGELPYVTDAGQLDRAIEGLYQTSSRDTPQGKYYHSLRSYLYRENVNQPKRNTLVEAYYDLTKGRAEFGVPINWMFKAYLERARAVAKTSTNQKRGNETYIKDEGSFKKHLYRYGRRIGESFTEEPTSAAPWLIDEQTGKVYLSPYIPTREGARATANILPLETGLRVLDKAGGEPLVPEVPKGRIPGGAQHHRTFTPAPGLPSPASGMLRTGGRTSAMAKRPGGGWSRAQQEWMAFQYERYRAEWSTNPNKPSFEEWLKGQSKEQLRQTWGGKTYNPGATSTATGITPRPSSTGMGPAKPPPPRGPRTPGPDDIKGPGGPKRTPMGSRVTGETKITPEDYGSPYRAGSSGLAPLLGKRNQRRQFVNPDKLRTGLWAQVLKIVSPTGMSYKAAPGKPLEPSRAAEQIIRAIEGQGRRQTARGSADMEPFVKAVYDLPRDAQLDLVHYIQTGGTEGALASLKKTHPRAVRQFERFTKMLANLYKSYEVEISTLDRGERQNFIKNYLPQLWREKDAWPSRSATFLKERKMPTYKDAMALKDKDGKPLFTPVTENPIEMTMMYMAAMRKFLDIRHSVQEARLAGYVRDLPYKHSPPPNTRLLNFTGRGGKRYYANEDFARVFNNYVSRGLHNSPELGSLHNAMLRLTNASTSLQLGLSAFHLSTMAKEGFLANLSDGIKALSQGKPVRGLRKIASSVVPGSYYRKGDQLLRAYLGQDFVSPEMEHMAQLAAKANIRLGELDEVYRATAMGSYAKNIVRGLQAGEGIRAGLKWAAKTEGKQFLKDVQAKPITSSLQLGGKLIETVAHPLFYHYIPRLKAGVFMERMSDFLRDNPEADMATQVREAQRFADVIDDQFGELVQNNLFWDATLKQTANLLLTSTGWTLGTLRLFGQGTADVLRGIGKTVTTGRAQPLTDRSAYLIATVIGVATLNALYQGIKGAGSPESVQDLATPRTGGETYQGDPERALIPGYEKDIMGWWHDPQGELYNKLGPLPKTVTEMYLNKDWRGDPIRDRSEDPLTQALQVAGHVIKMGKPITLTSAFSPTSPDTNLSVGERMMGVRAAGGWITNPERTEALENRASSRAWKRKLKHEERDKARRGFSYDDLVVPEPAPKPRRGFSYEDLTETPREGFHKMSFTPGQTTVPERMIDPREKDPDTTLRRKMPLHFWDDVGGSELRHQGVEGRPNFTPKGYQTEPWRKPWEDPKKQLHLLWQLLRQRGEEI